MTDEQCALMQTASEKATDCIARAFDEAYTIMVQVARATISHQSLSQLEEQLRMLEAQVKQVKAQLGQ